MGAAAGGWEEEYSTKETSGAQQEHPAKETPRHTVGTWYKDHDQLGVAGRLMLQLRKAVGCPMFKRKCTTLHAAVSIHDMHSTGGFVCMITWGAVNQHNDLKALLGGKTEVTGFGRFKASKLEGTGPISDKLYLHTSLSARCGCPVG